MAPTPSATPMAGSFRILRVFGIAVHLHWSWLLVAIFEIRYRATVYESLAWNVAEYLSLFAIVLLHEFGHALACRQVGGQADHIVLWPLGGIAIVNPPHRPSAWLWSIAAGPLVNVLLIPVIMLAALIAHECGLPEANPDAYQFIKDIGKMNFVLLFFNVLPIYPLDGGQVLYALLWFVLGRAKALLIASGIGLMTGTIVVGLAVGAGQTWLGIVAAFISFQSLVGLLQSLGLGQPLASTGSSGGGPGVPPSPGPAGESGLQVVMPGEESPVSSRCEECGETSVFAGWKRGTVQACPKCRASMDVGPVEEGEEWWQGQDAEGEDESEPPN